MSFSISLALASNSTSNSVFNSVLDFAPNSISNSVSNSVSGSPKSESILSSERIYVSRLVSMSKSGLWSREFKF